VFVEALLAEQLVVRATAQRAQPHFLNARLGARGDAAGTVVQNQKRLC
jgi:hypothetical protein